MKATALPRSVAMALLVLALPTGALEKMRGLQTHEARLEWKLPFLSDGTPSQSAVRVCLVFAGYAVLSSNVGMMGVFDVEFRSRSKGMRPEDVCSANFRGRSARPPADETYEPVGVIDHYLVAVYPDGFGVLGGFTLFDLDGGARVYQDAYVFDRDLIFKAGPGGPTMTYWSQLRKFDCTPRRGETSCWGRIREENGIPAKVPQPDCEDVIAKHPSALLEPDRALQVTLHVRVPRLSRRDATYLPDKPSCGLTP